MKRVLSLVLVLVLVLGSFPVFADEHEATYGEMLYDMELVLGDGQGDLMEDQALTRAQMMVVLARMYGVEDEAMAFVLPSTFTDVDADGYYGPYIAYGQMEGWTIGNGDGTFTPDAPLTADHAATFLLRVLGYSSVDDFEWDNAVEFAATLGIDVEAGVADDGAILRGELFEMMYKTLYTENVDGVLLAVQLGLEEAEPEDLEVVSVEALNLMQIEVVFNTEVDEDSAEALANYSVEDEDYDVLNATLQEDGKTVILYLDPTDAEDRQQEESVVVIEDVEALDNEDMVVPDTEMTVQFLDMTIPVATGAENTGINTFKIYFSEPMDTTELETEGNYEVKNAAGKKFYLKNAEALTDDLSVRIETFNDLSDGDYTIEVSGMEDYAGFTALTKTFTVEVEEDTEAPYVVDYKDAKPTEITLIWNEDIQLVGTLDETDFYHTNSNNVAEEVTIDENEMTIVFGYDDEDDLLPEGTAYVYVMKEVVEDYWENENAQQMVKVEIDLDTTPPAVDDVEVEEEDQIIITFSEDVDEGDDFELTLIQGGSDESDLISSWDIDGDEMTVDFDEDLDGEYALMIDDIVDKAIPTANSANLTVEFEVDDVSAPTGFSAKVYNADSDDQLIKVDFGEGMETSGLYSVTNIDNYMLHSDMFTTDSSFTLSGTGYYDLEDFEDIVTIVVVDDGEAVEIYLNSEDDDKDEYVTLINAFVTDGVVVARVADDSGNYTAAFSTDVDLEASGTIGIDTVHAVATDTIEVTLEDALVDIDGGDFQFVTSGETFTFEDDFGLDYDEDEDGNTVLIFEFFDINDVMDYYAEYDGNKIYLQVIDNDSENQYGEPIEPVTSADAISEVIDKIAPELAEIDGGDADGEEMVYVEAGDPDEAIVYLVFTEDIYDASYSTGTFTISGYDITGISETTAGIIELVVDLDGDDADDLIGKTVVQESAIRDTNSNSVSGLSAKIQDPADK